jgi:hypothetical protein
VGVPSQFLLPTYHRYKARLPLRSFHNTGSKHVPVRSLQNSCRAFERRTSHSIQGATILEIGIVLPSQSVHVWHLSNIIIMSVYVVVMFPLANLLTDGWVINRLLSKIGVSMGSYTVTKLQFKSIKPCQSHASLPTQLGLVNRLSSKSHMVSKGVIGITP